MALLLAGPLTAQKSLLQPAQSLLPKTDTLILADGTLLPILLKLRHKDGSETFALLPGIPKYDFSKITGGGKLRLNDSALQLARLANGHKDLMILNGVPTAVKFLWDPLIESRYYAIIDSSRQLRIHNTYGQKISYYKRNHFRNQPSFRSPVGFSKLYFHLSYGAALRFGGVNPAFTQNSTYPTYDDLYEQSRVGRLAEAKALLSAGEFVSYGIGIGGYQFNATGPLGLLSYSAVTYTVDLRFHNGISSPVRFETFISFGRIRYNEKFRENSQPHMREPADNTISGINVYGKFGVSVGAKFWRSSFTGLEAGYAHGSANDNGNHAPQLKAANLSAFVQFGF